MGILNPTFKFAAHFSVLRSAHTLPFGALCMVCTPCLFSGSDLGLWCDPGLVPNSRGNKAAANPRPRAQNKLSEAEQLLCLFQFNLLFALYQS